MKIVYLNMIIYSNKFIFGGRGGGGGEGDLKLPILSPP